MPNKQTEASTQLQDSIRRLQWHLWRLWRQESQKSGSMDLTSTEYDYLDVVAWHPEGLRLTDLAERSGGPARYVRIEETGQKIGFITPLTHNFCESCNRVRLTCTGELYMCLGQEDMADLRAPLRAEASDTALEQAIRNAIARKPKGHDFDYSRTGVVGQMTRHMSHTGG